MDDIWLRIVENLTERVTGPMKFRLFLQPLMAVIFAIRAGLLDAKIGNPPYFWGLLTERGQRLAILKDGWKSISKLFIFAIVLDLVYQFIVDDSMHFLQAIIVAFFLAILPYLLLRGLVTRLAHKK